MDRQRLDAAAKAGMRWVGWGAHKGGPIRVVLHECPLHGRVEVGSIDELTDWLRAHPDPFECWFGVKEKGVAADQRIWSSAYHAARHAERALQCADAGDMHGLVHCATAAARYGRNVTPGFDPYGAFEHEAKRVAMSQR